MENPPEQQQRHHRLYEWHENFFGFHKSRLQKKFEYLKFEFEFNRLRLNKKLRNFYLYPFSPERQFLLFIPSYAFRDFLFYLFCRRPR